MKKKHPPLPSKENRNQGVKDSGAGNHEKNKEESTGLKVTIPPELRPGGAEVARSPRSVRQSSSAPLCSKREAKDAVTEGVAAGWTVTEYIRNRIMEFAYKRPQLHQEDPGQAGEVASAAAGQSTNIINEGIPASGDAGTNLLVKLQGSYDSVSSTVAIQSQVIHLRGRQDDVAERLAEARAEEAAAKEDLDEAVEKATSPEKVAGQGARPSIAYTGELILRALGVLGISLVETLVFALAIGSLFGINMMILAQEWLRVPVWVIATFATAFGWTAVVMVGVHVTGSYFGLAFRSTSQGLVRFTGILMGLTYGSSTLLAIVAISVIRHATIPEGGELVPAWCFLSLTILLPLVSGWLLIGISELRALRRNIYEEQRHWDSEVASLSEPVRHLESRWTGAVKYRLGIEKEQQRIDQELAKLTKLIEKRENLARQRIDTEFLLNVAYAQSLETTLAVEERLFAVEKKRKENS